MNPTSLNSTGMLLFSRGGCDQAPSNWMTVFCRARAPLIFSTFQVYFRNYSFSINFFPLTTHKKVGKCKCNPFHQVLFFKLTSVCIASFPDNYYARASIQQAIADFHARTCLRFVPRTWQHRNSIIFYGPGYYSGYVNCSVNFKLRRNKSQALFRSLILIPFLNRIINILYRKFQTEVYTQSLVANQHKSSFRQGEGFI